MTWTRYIQVSKLVQTIIEVPYILWPIDTVSNWLMSSLTGFEQLPLDNSSLVNRSCRSTTLIFSGEFALLSHSNTCACVNCGSLTLLMFNWPQGSPIIRHMLYLHTYTVHEFTLRFTRANSFSIV